jgi:hypothetical protein
MSDPLALPNQPGMKKTNEIPSSAAITVPQAAIPMASLPGKPVSIDKRDVPVETTLDKLPKKPYWIGACSNAPFHSCLVGGIAFQRSSFSLVNGAPANPKIGSLIQLSDEQLRKVKEDSLKVAWRKNEIRKKVGKEIKVEVTWDRVDLRRASESLLPGDKLTAHYIFINELERGQKIPIGVMDEEGKPLPSPKPLISE